MDEIDRRKANLQKALEKNESKRAAKKLDVRQKIREMSAISQQDEETMVSDRVKMTEIEDYGNYQYVQGRLGCLSQVRG